MIVHADAHKGTRPLSIRIHFVHADVSEWPNEMGLG